MSHVTVSKPKSARAPPSREVRISKSLSYLLRHAAEAQGLSIDLNGYVAVPAVLAHHRLKADKASFGDIQLLVASNDKQRFTLKRIGEGDEASAFVICANQGHSLKGVANLESMTQLTTRALFPEIAIHGTTVDKLPLILASGLSRMRRNHIHLAKGLPGADGVISGMRKNCSAVIYLDLDKCWEQVQKGTLTFYESVNGVILCAGNAQGVIPKELFLKVTNGKGEPLNV